MKNNRGSILIITTAFAFGFTALGIASIYLAGQEAQFAQREVSSIQAFWFAEGGIQLAKSLLPAKNPLIGNIPSTGTAQGNYSVSIINPCNSDPSQYCVFSTGTNSNKNYPYQQIIKATYEASSASSSFTFTNRMEIGNSSNDDGFGAAVDSLLTSNPALAFYDVFGISMPSSTNLYGFTPLTSNTIGSEPAGIYYATPPSGTLDASSINIPGNSVLIVNGNLKIETGSGNFTGIIWVTGNFTRGSNGSNITGAVFVQGTASSSTGNAGYNGNLSFSNVDAQSAVKAAQSPYLLSWKECVNSNC